MPNYKAVIQYDGTEFYGWNIQPNKRTVQGQIKKLLERIFKEKIKIYAGARTDRGAHSLGQVINFLTKKLIAPSNLKKALNSILPDDIFVKKLQIVDENFNARFSAKSRTYIYIIDEYKRYNPFLRNYLYYINFKPDIKKMSKAAKYLVGEYDFTTFSSTDSVGSKVKEIKYIKIYKNNKKQLVFEIKSTGFLMHMVRIIVGSLLKVGEGKKEPIWIKQILENKDNRKAGNTLPSRGLYLKNIEY